MRRTKTIARFVAEEAYPTVMVAALGANAGLALLGLAPLLAAYVAGLTGAMLINWHEIRAATGKAGSRAGSRYATTCSL